MRQTPDFKVLLASDGSPVAKAAVRAGVRFPWPAGTKGFGVVVRHSPREVRLSILLAAFDESCESTARGLRRVLAPRWPVATVAVVEGDPVAGILSEAARLDASAIVVGWRGQGPVQRLLAGSVSRGVVRRATCPVLVVRKAPPAMNHLVVGVDGSDNSRAAVDLVARLEPAADGRVTLVTAVENLGFPSQPLTPAITAEVAREVKRINKERIAEARCRLDEEGRRLADSGWKLDLVVAVGAPLRVLLSTAVERQADLLVVGARGTSGMARLLLGSVAEGALNRSPFPVLVVR